MLVSHESPIDMLDKSRDYNDYDYALVHLFETHPKYYEFFKESLLMDRDVLLDNSIFELGEAYDNESFAKWVDELKPTEYIVPDALEDMEKTVNQMEEWNKNYRNLPGKKIGVVQGKTPDELNQCYVYMNEYADVDKIAISFDYSLYEKVIPHTNKYMSWMLGRAAVLANMVSAGIINTNKSHHLLGCGLPQEFALYRDYKWIESIDTSNPIVHGIKGIKYEYGGLQNKESIKLVDLLDVDITTEQLYDINHNISYFRKYVNG